MNSCIHHELRTYYRRPWIRNITIISSYRATKYIENNDYVNIQQCPDIQVILIIREVVACKLTPQHARTLTTEATKLNWKTYEVQSNSQMIIAAKRTFQQKSCGNKETLNCQTEPPNCCTKWFSPIRRWLELPKEHSNRSHAVTKKLYFVKPNLPIVVRND